MIHHHHQQQYHRHQLDHHRSPQKVRRDQRFSKHGHNLRIERVGPKDNGEYTCEVATIILNIFVFFIFGFIIDVFTEVKSYSFSSRPHYRSDRTHYFRRSNLNNTGPSYYRWRRKTEIIRNLLLISKLILIVMIPKVQAAVIFWVLSMYCIKCTLILLLMILVVLCPSKMG